MFRADDDAARTAIPTLVDAGRIEPVATAADARLWQDAELASLVENRFHVPLDPLTVTGAERQAWMQKALAPGERIVDPRGDSYRAGFWILDREGRAGTLAIDAVAIGASFLRLSSLYVFSAARGRGVAPAALAGVQRAAASAGFSAIRLSTHWTWQPAVRFYLRLGMWACSFKRSIDFAWIDALAPRVIELEDTRAMLWIVNGADRVPLIMASRHGERLEWEESPMAEQSHSERAGIDSLYARATFAVALAVAGWPLLRSREAFDESRGWDIGGPEVLAYKIAVFEYFDRRHGFGVLTPRIPGLPYDEVAQRFDGE